ncbi:MAG TPA: response regulator, partial [Anaeromyxobacteraceae bacterium]|nr:response regulator [Anaeromyxobacteraceae bacterium]
YRTTLHAVAVELRLAEAVYSPDVGERLSFWIGREGGWVRPLSGMAPADVAKFREGLARCEVSLRGVRADRYELAVRRVLSLAGVAIGTPVPPQPALVLHVGGKGWEAFSYDRRERVLHVPSPLAPPIGDEFAVELRVPGRAELTFRGPVRVVSSRDLRSAGPLAPAGFGLALPRGGDAAHLLLATRCARPGDGQSTRASPRYRVTGRARLFQVGGGAPGAPLEDPGEAGFVQNLSQGGAFVRTSRPHAVGERLDLHLDAPGALDVSIPGVVAHAGPAGVGLRFSHDAGAEAVLAAAMASLAGGARRVLVVDDDALARKMLSDTFQARGFDVVTAANGEEALRTLASEILSVDAVVTDVFMPGSSGEDLVRAVRHAGGETALPLVAVTAGLDGAARARLVEAGADAILLKSLGPNAAVEAVEASLDLHRGGLGDRAGGDPAALAGAAG